MALDVRREFMNAMDIKKAKKIRYGLMVVSGGLCLIGVLALFFPATDTLMVRWASAAVCLIAAVAWGLPALLKVSFSRCLNFLVFANVALLVGLGQIEKLLYRTKWNMIYEEVGRLTQTSPFDFDLFASDVSRILRSGGMLTIGIVAIWILNILALLYLTQTEKDKEANHAPEDTARKLADPRR